MSQSARAWQTGSSDRGWGRWIFPALMASLLLHLLLWYWAANYHVPRQPMAIPPAAPTRTFHVEHVKVDPKLFEPVPAAEKKPMSVPQTVSIPEEAPSLGKAAGDTAALPVAPKLDAGRIAAEPNVVPPTFNETVKAAEAAGIAPPVSSEKSLTDQLLQDHPVAGAGPAADLPKPAAAGAKGVSGAASKVPGFSNLDDLLAQTGPLTPETAPILMPGDLLFDYDAAELQPGARSSLEKLGVLMKRNPMARFAIEGHTDSFGSDEYNNDLSLRRANSVKAFLTDVIGIPADTIETKGYGKSRLIAPASGTIAEQQINRRVEIVIRSANP